MAFGDSDLGVFARQMGVPVSFAGVSTGPDGQPVMGLFDRWVEAKLGEQGFGGVETGMPEVRLARTAFDPMPAAGDYLVVDGTGYTVDDVSAEDDGSIVCYTLLLQEMP